MKKTFILILILTIGLYTYSQKIIPPSPIKWYTMQEALTLNKDKPRPIMIDFYTDWCGYCTQMMNTTFTDPTVSSYINNNYYAVRFNAEGNDTVTYNDTVYKAIPGTKTHPFAVKLMDGNMVYPTISFITKKGNRANIPGFQDATKFIPILIYFAEEIFASSTYEDWEKYFYKVYPPDKKSGYTMVRSLVKWMKLEEALAANAKKPKKIFLDFNVNWNNASTVMLMTTYTDTTVANLLNNNFYPVRIDATTKDTLTFGQPYVNDGKLSVFHQLPVAMLNGKMKFPATLYLDENSKLINVMQEYISPEFMIPILKYYGLNIYKTRKWQEYYSEYIKKEEDRKKKEELKKNNVKQP